MTRVLAAPAAGTRWHSWRLVPVLTPPPLGEEAVRETIRVGLVCYAGAVVLMLLEPGRERLARRLWTVAWAVYVIHVGLAFHYYHGWSHADAVAHTQAVAGWGGGIYVSYAFTLVWGLDVAWWWLAPAARARRPAWLGGLLHGFLAFILFNGAVV